MAAEDRPRQDRRTTSRANLVERLDAVVVTTNSA
jgi:hypothetical protein